MRVVPRVAPPLTLVLLMGSSPVATGAAQTSEEPRSEGATDGDSAPEEAEGVEETTEEPTERRPLRVVASGGAPFVMTEEGELTGISLAVWRALADDLGLEYELEELSNAGEAVDAVAQGDADVAIGPISIRSDRARRVAFTQPYYEGSLSIAAPREGPGFFHRLAPFLSSAFLGGAGALLLVLSVVGTLFWVVERKKNDTIAERPLKGIGTGVWLAIVTMTTVGYGDRVPITPMGRFVAGVWMLLSMVVVSSLTAFLATALTLTQLETGVIAQAQDLDSRRVAVVEGTTSVAFVRLHGGVPVRQASIEDAVRAVAESRADAVVYDRPILEWYLGQHEELDVALSEAHYEPQGYGFALPQGDELRSHLDVALLELEESDEIADVVSRWL